MKNMKNMKNGASLVSVIAVMFTIITLVIIGGCVGGIYILGCTAKKINNEGLKNITTQIWEGTNSVQETKE